MEDNTILVEKYIKEHQLEESRDKFIYIDFIASNYSNEYFCDFKFFKDINLFYSIVKIENSQNQNSYLIAQYPSTSDVYIKIDGEFKRNKISLVVYVPNLQNYELLSVSSFFNNGTFKYIEELSISKIVNNHYTRIFFQDNISENIKINLTWDS